MMKDEERELGHEGLPLLEGFKQFAADRDWKLSNFSPYAWKEAYETFKAGYDFAKSGSNDKSVVSNYLNEARRRFHSDEYADHDYVYYLKEVFEEWFGKEGEEKNG